MQGLLIYKKEDEIRNIWFINHMIEVAKKYDVNLKLLICDCDDKNFLLDELYDTRNNGKYDFAIVRTFESIYAKYIEEYGIKVFNNAYTVKIANDKYLTLKLARDLGIETMHTEYNTKPLSFPSVLKKVDGHGGENVHLIKNMEKYEEIMNIYNYDKYIVQDVAMQSETEISREDMRVYMIGDRVISSVKRIAKFGFRANYSLGGSFEKCCAPNYVMDVVSKLYNELKFDFVGIDFIYHKGKWILNEIESTAGYRMLYELGEIDAADKIIRYVVKEMKHKNQANRISS